MKTFIKILAIIGGYIVLNFIVGMFGGFATVLGLANLEDTIIGTTMVAMFGWPLVIFICLIVLIVGIVKRIHGKAA